MKYSFLAHPLRPPKYLSSYTKIAIMVQFHALFTSVPFACIVLCCLPAYWTPTYPNSFSSSLKASIFLLGTSSFSDTWVPKHCARAFPGFVHCWWGCCRHFFYCSVHKKFYWAPWPVWLSWLQCRPMDLKVAGLIPSQGTCLGCGCGPGQGAC